MNSIMLLCGKFNNAHLDTSFVSFDPKIMKLRPIEGITYPGIWKLHLIPLITDLFTMHGHDGRHLFGHVLVSFVIYNNKGSGCKKSISTVTIKFSQRNLLVMWLNLTANWPMFHHFTRLERFKLQTIFHQILNIFNHSASLICICFV